MHEISLVRSIFSTLEAKFSKEELAMLTDIDLKVGLLSNVEPILMHNAFEAVTTAERIFNGVSLNMEMVPIEIYCMDCDQYSIIENYTFICSSCGKPNNHIVKGTELLIQSVHFMDKEVESA